MLGFIKKKIKETIKKAKEKQPEEIIEEPTEEIQEKPKKEKANKSKPTTKEKKVCSIDNKEECLDEPEVIEEKSIRKEKPKKGGLKENDIEDIVWELQIALLESDVATDTAEEICNNLKEDLLGEKVKKKNLEDVIKESLRDSLRNIMSQEPIDLIKKIKDSDKPFKILFIGFNGAGKTTTVARVAKLLQKNKLKPVMAAADTWRAAAIQQLEKHGDNLGIKVISHDYGSDAAAEP